MAREYLVALPVELSDEQRVDLARGFSKELTVRYRFAVDLAVHEPRNYPGSDPRNFHAHLLATTREVGVEGLGMKTTLEWNDARRRESGLGPAINELLHVRERWAIVTNAALERAHVAARVDHRSLQQQGIDREPMPHLPRAVFEMERHGYRTVVGDRLRDQYQARVDARLSKSSEVQPAVTKNAEDVRREARESWLRMRENGQHNLQGAAVSQSRDDDHSL